MKKYILTLALIFSLIPSFSQTKLETEEWIKGKFSKWKINDSQYDNVAGMRVFRSSEAPISLSFQDCSLNFKSITSFEGGIHTEKNYYLNIGDIKEIKWVVNKFNNYLTIITTKGSVKVTTVTKQKFATNYSSSQEDISYSGQFMIAFNTDGEDNFKERMLKAFNHLKRFCQPTIKPKETF